VQDRDAGEGVKNMRLSILQNDPGYSAKGFAGVKVLLNGTEVSNPVTANEDDGWVRSRLERSEETYVRRGEVKIVPLEIKKSASARKPGFGIADDDGE
jgi:hypothetical protein